METQVVTWGRNGDFFAQWMAIFPKDLEKRSNNHFIQPAGRKNEVRNYPSCFHEGVQFRFCFFPKSPIVENGIKRGEFASSTWPIRKKQPKRPKAFGEPLMLLNKTYPLLVGKPRFLEIHSFRDKTYKIGIFTNFQGENSKNV